MDFRFHFRRKSTLIRQKSPTDLKKILVGRLECRYPDGNEIHSCRLHFSNGNSFEQLKFYILHIDLVGLVYILRLTRISIDWSLNQSASHVTLSLRQISLNTFLLWCWHEQCSPTYFLSCFPSYTHEWCWHCISCVVGDDDDATDEANRITTHQVLLVLVLYSPYNYSHTTTTTILLLV